MGSMGGVEMLNWLLGTSFLDYATALAAIWGCVAIVTVFSGLWILSGSNKDA